MRTPRRGLAVPVIALVAAAAPVVARRVGVVDDLALAFERKSQDYRMAWYRGPELPPGVSPADIVIVAVDEPSLASLGRFALWPRSYHARLLDTLMADGARTVAFDLLFPEPDVLPAAALQARATEVAARGVPPERAYEILSRVGGDAAFADALARSGRAWLAGSSAEGAGWPLPSLAAAAAGVGHVLMGPDPDGIVRRVPLRVDGPQGPVDALGLAAARAFGAPSDASGVLRLDFAGPPGTFTTVSYADVLGGRVPAALLRDRLVFVGATASGLGDVFTTPFGADMPGVEVHATLAHQLLTGRGIHPRPAWAFPAGLVLALLVTFMALRFGPVVSTVGALGVATAWTVTCFEAFASGGWELPLITPLMAWGSGLVLAAGYRYVSVDRKRRAVQRAFGRYVPREIVDEIARRPEALGLGGEEREVTVGFVDVRGFTGISEKLPPRELAHFLNSFFSTVEAQVHAHRGMVDKYIGDAVMMVFGAPAPDPNHAAQACAAALAIREAVAARAASWSSMGLGPVRIGIGLETGPAAVGNFGSDRRFEYTALGDTVNVAARLQDLNKELGTTVVVGPGTRAAADRRFRFREATSVRLRGRAQYLTVHELMAASDATESTEPSDATPRENV